MKPTEHHKKHRYKKPAIVIAAILTLFAAAVLILFPPGKPLATTGGCKAVMTTLEMEDISRTGIYTKGTETRKLSVDFYYPDVPTGQYPLIVFSHGAFGIKTSNESLCLELASHGYVVCAIGHTYQSLFTKIDGRTVWMDAGYRQEVLSEDAHKDKAQSLEYYKKWMEVRTGDIEFVLDEVLEQAAKKESGQPFQLVDETRIGLVGHSLGGSAVLGVGRTRPGIKGVVALESPYLCDIKGVRNDAFVFEEDPYPIPVLNIYTDSAWPHLAEWAQYGGNHRLLRDESPDVQNIHLPGTGHFSITDLALASPILTRILNGGKTTVEAEACLRDVNRLTLEFFNQQVKERI